MKAIFIAGTDTGVGKTIICGLLAKHLADKGKRVITQKWVQTGCSSFSEDILLHQKIIGGKNKDSKNYLQLRCPYIFKPAVSPHLAARLEKKKINPQKIKKSFQSLLRKFDYVIAEGTGGLLVPFNEKQLLVEMVKELGLPVLLVAQNKLGTINHTLLTLEALRLRKIKLLGIVFNNLKGEENKVLKDNPRIIRSISKSRIFGSISWNKDFHKLFREFTPIGKKICRAMKK
ncbi:MAG: dethiobiotin synthase [Candidatus Omnitrophica bacterium]|nr:dethiobiotin synthase [Candidatus Omnitrophota bacterium]